MMTSTDFMYMLIDLVVNFGVFLMVFQLLSVLLHCFYDDSIDVSLRRLPKAIIVYVICTVIVVVTSFVIGFICGQMIGAELIEEEQADNSVDFWTLIQSVPMYFGWSYLITHKKGLGFKRNFCRSITGMLLFFVISSAVSLMVEMIRYCFTESGIFSLHLLEVGYKNLLLNDCFNLLVIIPVFLLLYFRVYKKGITLRMRKSDAAAIMMYSLIEIILVFFFNVIETKKISLVGGNLALRVILVALMALLLIVAPVLIIRSRISASYQELNAYQESFLETELNASRQYKAAQEDTRAFRHDVQNNLAAIAMLMQDGKMDEAQQYLNDMRTEVSALSPKVVTGDDMVDSLISAKLAKMEELGITFKTDGVIDGGLKWKPMDICTVFANMLDNAIEAAAQTENGFIKLEFKKSEHHRLIRESNSCAEDADCEALMSGGSHITTKADKALHGYGLSNIRKTLEKNGGMMKISCAEHVFTMEIILTK